MQKVLWVDDDIHQLQIVKFALEESGYIVTITPDVSSAVEHLRSTCFDFLLVDGSVTKGGFIDSDEDFTSHLPDNAPVLGLHFIKAARATKLWPPDKPAILCTRHDLAFLERIEPQLMAGQPYLSKATILFSHTRFVDEIRRLSGSVTSGRENGGGSKLAPSERERDYENRWHDLRNGIASVVPTLALVAERLFALANVDEFSQEALSDALARFASEAVIAIDALAYSVSRKEAYIKAETNLQYLEEEMKSPARAKVAMLAGLAETIFTSLSQLPKTTNSARVAGAWTHLQMLLCGFEISIANRQIVQSIQDTDPQTVYRDEGPFDSSIIINQIVEMYHLRALSRRIEFDLYISPELVLDHGSASSYFRLISNLIDNAVKYNGQIRGSNAWIEVRHFMRGPDIVTDIESWGAPVPKMELNALRDRGYRATTAHKPGRGLGLDIAEEVAATFRGRVTINSGKVRKGRATTTVTVHIPQKPILSPQ